MVNGTCAKVKTVRAPLPPDQQKTLTSRARVNSILPTAWYRSAQCRGARALLGMTQPQLAEAAKLGLSTIVNFARGRRQVSDDAIVAMQTALARAGVEFINENGGGPGVR